MSCNLPAIIPEAPIGRRSLIQAAVFETKFVGRRLFIFPNTPAAWEMPSYCDAVYYGWTVELHFHVGGKFTFHKRKRVWSNQIMLPVPPVLPKRPFLRTPVKFGWLDQSHLVINLPKEVWSRKDAPLPTGSNPGKVIVWS